MREINLETERDFENSKVHDKSVRRDQSKYYWSTQLNKDRHENHICKKIVGKKVLEIGSSQGNSAIRYSKYCREYVGVDISDEAVRVANNKNIDRCSFITCDAHSLPFGDEEFDFVIVNSLLHHMDLKVILEEINRVLKYDGGLFFREPLGINPLFQKYRSSTPEARTEDENPFDLSDLRLLKQHFRLSKVEYFGFLSLLSAFNRSHLLRSILSKIDELISLTPVKYLFWQIAGFGKK